jgi:hypothetical protein
MINKDMMIAELDSVNDERITYAQDLWINVIHTKETLFHSIGWGRKEVCEVVKN